MGEVTVGQPTYHELAASVGKVMAMQPDYGGGDGLSHRMFWSAAIRRDSPLQGKLYQDRWPGSFEAGNVLIATTLNAMESGENFTHVAMLHNDVCPEAGWLDVMMEELLRSGADLLSAVIPIKDTLGLSSTAIDSDHNPFEVRRRLTMTEVYRLPETFGIEDVPGYGDRPWGDKRGEARNRLNGRCDELHRERQPYRLLVNTGCFIMDCTKPWFREENADGTLVLTMTSPDRICRRKSGQWEAQHSPSDWRFSRDVARLGGKVMATRKLKLLHIGLLPYTNQTPWGEWETDQSLAHNFGGIPIGKTAADVVEGKDKPASDTVEHPVKITA